MKKLSLFVAIFGLVAFLYTNPVQATTVGDCVSEAVQRGVCDDEVTKGNDFDDCMTEVTAPVCLECTDDCQEDPSKGGDVLCHQVFSPCSDARL